MKTKFAVIFAASLFAMAAQAEPWTDKIISEDTTVSDSVIINSATQNGGVITITGGGVEYDRENSKGDYTLNDGEIVVGDGLAFSVRDFVMNGGKITAVGSSYTRDPSNRTYPAFGAYNSFVMNDGEVELSNGGRLWIGTANKSDPASYGRMQLKGGTITMNNGLITGNKRVINSETMKGYTGDEVVAGNTIGFDGATILVNGGTNTVDALQSELTAGTINVANGATLEFVSTKSTNETDEGAAGKYAKANSFRMTGGELVVTGNVDASALHDTDFVGGTVTMNGGTLTTGGEAVFNTTVNVKQGGSVIDGKIVNMVGGLITFDAEGSDPAMTIESDSFDLLGGTIDLTNGRMRVTSDSYIGGGVVNGTNVTVDSANKVAITKGDIAFSKLEFEGGVINATTFKVTNGSTFTYAANSGARFNLTGDGAAFENNGTIDLYGLNGHNQGQKIEQILGINGEIYSGTGTVTITDNGNAFVTSATYDAENGVQIDMVDSVANLTDEALKGSAYAGAGLAVAAGAGDINGDLTAFALNELAYYQDYVGADEAFADGASAIAAFDDMIETVSARGLAAYTIANDVQRLINDGVEARNMSSIYQGGGVWANVFYSQNSADSLYGERAGYETDIYGGQLGFDWTASCGYRLGAVLSIGTADSNNTGRDFTDTDIDSDFYGFSIYASKQIERLTFGLDVGYTKIENDLTTHAFGKKFDDSVDANVWTAGVRANILAWDGETVKVTPHVGLRYNRIDMDDMGITEQDDMNLIEMPVGVAFSANFEAAGWTVAPVLDLSLVPQIGDKDVNITVRGANGTDFDVVDGSLFRTTLGVEAAYGNFGLGLNYKYGTSSEDRDDHSVNLNAVYRF